MEFLCQITKIIMENNYNVCKDRARKRKEKKKLEPVYRTKEERMAEIKQFYQ